jgi:hypothetical protein
MSFLICTRNGQPLMVSFIAMATTPSAEIDSTAAMPKSTMLSPNSGSMTAFRRKVTSATLGGAAPVVCGLLPVMA